jgi:osmoprotectant transport system ATP-binding protein
MDEPFGALDPITRDELQNDFKRLHREMGLTAVMVTHDMTEALLMADRIAVMQDGRLVGLGTPHDLLTDPPHEYVETLMTMPKRQADAVESIAQGS